MQLFYEQVEIWKSPKFLLTEDPFETVKFPKLLIENRELEDTLF